MEIYKVITKFDVDTGKPKPKKAWHATRCDFSGRVVAGGEMGDSYPAYECKIKLDYEDQDPCFGSGGDEYKFGQEYGIYVFDFLSQPYVIFDDFAETGESEMKNFLAEVVKYDSLAHALRSMRIATADKLIKDGVVKPEELFG